MRTNAQKRPGSSRPLLCGALLSLGALSLPALALAQQAPTPGLETQPNTTGPGSLDGPRTPVSEGQAESTTDMLGTDRLLEPRESDVPVTEGQAESRADALGGVDDEGTFPLGPQPAGTGAEEELGFGEQGVLDLGEQPRAVGRNAGIEGQDLPDTDLGARGVDVDGARVEPIFPDANRAARGGSPPSRVASRCPSRTRTSPPAGCACKTSR